MPFSGDVGATLHQSLKDAAETIAKMPATFMTYPNGGPILPVTRTARRLGSSHLLLDQAYLSGFGVMRVPAICG